MKKVLLILVFCLMLFTTVACEKDETNNNCPPAGDTGNGGNGGQEESNAPEYTEETGTIMYMLVINGTYEIPLYYEGKWTDDESYDQHHVYSVALNEGDVITFLNASNNETWTDMTVDPYSSGGMVLISGVGIEVGETGVYDIYLKTKFEADNIYFGPAA